MLFYSVYPLFFVCKSKQWQESVESLFIKNTSGIIILNFSTQEFGTERHIHKMFFFKQQFWNTDNPHHVFMDLWLLEYQSRKTTAQAHKHCHSVDITAKIYCQTSKASQPLNRCSIHFTRPWEIPAMCLY